MAIGRCQGKCPRLSTALFTTPEKVPHRSHRFGLFSRYFPDFFSHFFSSEPLKNAGFSRSILAILDSWAMGHRED